MVPRHAAGQEPTDEQWVFRAPQLPRGAHLRSSDRTATFPAPHPPQPPVGLPDDLYGDGCWTEVPPLVRGRVPMPLSVNPYGVPTVDHPRSEPRTVGPPLPPAEPQSRAIRFMDWFRDVGPSLLLAAMLLAALAATSLVAYRSDQRVKTVEEQNQDLRQVQIDQQKRIAQLESKTTGK
jgi:hypothetical protein